MRKIIIGLTILLALKLNAQNNMKQIKKDGMTVKWEIVDDQLHVEMSAPTEGWVTVGFNENSNITGAYLLMGRVRNGKAEVVEHFTSSPGNYQPISNYKVPNQVKDIKGSENGKNTELTFKIPIAAASKYHKHLTKGSTWSMIMAYSLEDDFQHHSIRRTSVSIKL